MKITKFVHSCLLVETPERTAIFDPGVMSESALDPDALQRLDDIFITHNHGDHLSEQLLRQLYARFPHVRITGPPEVVAQLQQAGIAASSDLPDGVRLFAAPHESVAPLFPQPEEFGYHYLEQLSHPGDCHSFKETMAILALPVTAPWGSFVRAINLALERKPQHVLPIHDWHWSDAARTASYDIAARVLGEQGIHFHRLQTGQPVSIEV